MLHKTFKPAKCKTALKLAVSRIKLLRNKREAQVKQLKRELAQLLESGQDQTARIRVEHVVREEKTMAAYDLIEIYCELIAARLPIIESQKNCPIDLKEAISSVIFASPRCSDVPELIDVRKHITAKYGKEFVSAALELRPDCGVNRMLVEKLSAKAPDGPTKVKILTAIAEEHNVNWEHKSFGENDVNSTQFSQVGLNTNEKASYVEPPHLHVSPVRDEKGPPTFHASSQHREMHDDISTTLDEHNASYGEEKVGGNKSTTSGRSNLEIRSSGTGSQAMDFRDPYSENKSSTDVGRKKWNIEFKDAASAAQAAAESAEHASMAARAAAELSNREKLTRLYSTGSQSSSGSGLRDEAAEEHLFYDEKHLSKKHARMAAQAAAELSNREKVTGQFSSESRSFSGSGLSHELPQEYAFRGDKHLSKGSVSTTFRNSSFGMHNEQAYAREQDNQEAVPAQFYKSGHENVVKYGDSAPLTSSSAYDDVNPFGDGAQKADIYPHEKLFEQKNSDLRHEVSMNKQASITTDADFDSELHGDMNTEKNIYFGDAKMNKQSKKASSSNFITPSDDHIDVLSSQKMGSKAVGDPFITDSGNSERNFMETSSYHDTSVVFDDSGSEGDDYKFVDDKMHDEQGSSLYFPSPSSKWQIDPLAYRNSWIPEQVIDEKQGSSSSQSHFSVVPENLTKSTVSFKNEELLPVAFDDSDGPSSDIEEDLVKSDVMGGHSDENGVSNQSASQRASRTSSRDVENVGSNRKSGLLPSSGGSNSLEEHFERNIQLNTEKKFGYEDLPQPSSKGRSSVLGLNVKETIHSSLSPDSFNNTEASEESHLESGKELSYETFKGGLHHKGNRPPYIRRSSGRDSSSLGDMSIPNEHQSSPTVRTSVSTDDCARDTYLRKVSTRNRSTGLTAHYTSDFDSYDLLANPQEIVTSTQDPRTQKNRSVATKKSSLKSSVTYVDSDSSASEDELPEQNSVSLARPVSGFSRRTSAHLKSSTDLHSNDAPLPSTALGWKSSRDYESENQKKASSWMRSSDSMLMASSEHGSVKHAASKPVLDSNRSLLEETIKSSSTMQPSSSLPKTVIPDRAEASNSINSGGYTPPKEKASHVHPKLPDYDSFTAHFLSLKKGRE